MKDLIKVEIIDEPLGEVVDHVPPPQEEPEEIEIYIPPEENYIGLVFVNYVKRKQMTAKTMKINYKNNLIDEEKRIRKELTQ